MGICLIKANEKSIENSLKKAYSKAGNKVLPNNPVKREISMKYAFTSTILGVG
jgi:hypothetical protein